MTTERTPPKILNDIIDGLSQAIGASSQIIHLHQDPRWMFMRDFLERSKSVCTGYATFQGRIIHAVKK